MTNSILSPIMMMHIVIVDIFASFTLTIVGRKVASYLPYRIKSHARMYLAPVLGLAIFILLASTIGHVYGFSTIRFYVVATTFIISIWSFSTDNQKYQCLVHASCVSLVAIITSSVILMPIIRFGGYDTYHTDAFTYLVHGNWLQNHSFFDTIRSEQSNLYTNQVSFYQDNGFRMGGSYFLGWLQAVTNEKWSYVSYPSALAMASVSFSFAVIYCVALITKINKIMAYLFACLPALSSGTMTFSLVRNYMPQAFGLATAVAFLALVGAILSQLCSDRRSNTETNRWKSSIIPSILFSSCLICYSELSPFVCAGFLLSAALFAFKFPHKKFDILRFFARLFFISTIIINIELYRILKSIMYQSHAKVGINFDWSLFDFAGFAFGIKNFHLGQHLSVGNEGWIFDSVWLHYALIYLIFIFILWTWCCLTTKSKKSLIPLFSYAIVCLVGFIYFRYLSPDVYVTSNGDTHAQFKITNWVYPVCIVLLIGSASPFINHANAYIVNILSAFLVLIGLSYNYFHSNAQHIVADLSTGKPIFENLLNIRTAAKNSINLDDPIYIKLSDKKYELGVLLTYILHEFNISNSELHSKYIITTKENLLTTNQADIIWQIGSVSMINARDFVR